MFLFYISTYNITLFISFNLNRYERCTLGLPYLYHVTFRLKPMSCDNIFLMQGRWATILMGLGNNY